ncbi:MAG TPA: hypothetical protein VIL74_05420 [Pyrinomonadaceae bacterium]|jgi:hypothetical protein
MNVKIIETKTNRRPSISQSAFNSLAVIKDEAPGKSVNKEFSVLCKFYAEMYKKVRARPIYGALPPQPDYRKRIKTARIGIKLCHQF